jgi:hypothetical protein
MSLFPAIVQKVARYNRLLPQIVWLGAAMGGPQNVSRSPGLAPCIAVSVRTVRFIALAATEWLNGQAWLSRGREDSVRQRIFGMVMLALLGGCAARGAPASSADLAGSSCSAPAVAPCQGCSVTCAAGQHPVCKSGDLTSGDNPACWDLAKCECQ